MIPQFLLLGGLGCLSSSKFNDLCWNQDIWYFLLRKRSSYINGQLLILTVSKNLKIYLLGSNS